MEKAGGLTVQLRPYQQQALDALDAFWDAGGGNPLVSMATATGKSMVIAQLFLDIRARFPGLRALVLVHVRELVVQNFEHLTKMWTDAPFGALGINCASLKRRDWDAPIIFATVQSVWKHVRKLGPRHLIIGDECHLWPKSGDGMYRTLLAGQRRLVPNLRVAGFTATPYRLDSGYLCEGEDKIFDQVVYEYSIADGIKDRYLAPLSSKATEATIDVSDVAVRAGEFVAEALEDAADNAAIVEAACDEIIARGKDRRSWLLFCCGVKHARHVAELLRARGFVAATVTAKTPAKERDSIIAGFHNGTIRTVTNVNVLTTGFNVPSIDLIGMLRPTLSPGLYVQMLGRGTRKAEGKFDCLVLDFAGNVMRHGPVNLVNGARTTSKTKADDVNAKECPECGELCELRAEECDACGHKFPQPKPRVPKHSAVADYATVLGTSEWLPVSRVDYRHHVKYSDPSAPPSLRVEYLVGFNSYTEWVSLRRGGYAREMASRWWYAMGGEAPVPLTVDQALERCWELDKVTAIRVVRDGKWWRVIERRVTRSDGTEGEINRHLICLSAHRPPASSVPIDDAIPY